MNLDASRFFYRETPSGFSQGEGKIIRQRAGGHEFAHVRISVQPSERGTGVTPIWKAGSDLPARFVGPVTEGVLAALERGVQTGFQVTDVRVTVESGSYHDIDSTDAVFRDAAGKAVVEALQKAAPIAMEAVLAVLITVHEEFAGAVMNFVNSRDGLVEAMETQRSAIALKASLPAASLFELMQEVITATQGRASISHSIIRFEAKTEPPPPPEEWVAFT